MQDRFPWLIIMFRGSKYFSKKLKWLKFEAIVNFISA